MTTSKPRSPLMMSTAAAALMLAGALATGVAAPAHGATQVDESRMEQKAPLTSPTGHDVRKPAAMGFQYRASEVIGHDVTNIHGDKIGTVDDLVVSRRDKVTYAVVSVGGFLGIGDKLVAVDFDRLHFSPRESLVLHATKAELESLPAFTFNDTEANYRAMAEEEYEAWRSKVSAYAAEAKLDGKEAKAEATEKLDAAWAEVEKQWAELKDATGETWDKTKQQFEIAWSKFEQAWNDATRTN